MGVACGVMWRGENFTQKMNSPEVLPDRRAVRLQIAWLAYQRDSSR
jgi:hypothetical protein